MLQLYRFRISAYKESRVLVLVEWIASRDSEKVKKASSTLRTSRAVTHPSTIRAFRRLTSEFGWDPVFSTQYGR